MPRYCVTVTMTSRKDINVYAEDEEEAKEKACDVVEKWNGVIDAEAEDCEEE